MHKINTARLGAWLITASASLSAFAVEPPRQHGAHQHGSGELRVVIEGQQLQIQLESPAMNLVGFEHQPRNDAQKKALRDMTATLRDAGQVFALPAQAQCALKGVELKGELVNAKAGHKHGHKHEHKHKHGHGHKHESKHTDDDHSDIEATYRYTCAQPGALRDIDVKLFALFPKTDKLKLTLIGPKGQTAGELTRAKSRIVF
jgi:ABC-type nickel/cobalt efflux system permease component RcnA